MELQQTIERNPTERVVVAMSYDPVDVLAAFAEEHGITYPLLSDEGSRVIRELGLENSVAEQQNAHFGLATDERHVGMPFPGTFHLDASGVITARWFEQSHRVRPSATLLLDDEVTAAVSDRSVAADVEVEASLPTDTYHPQQIYRLRVRLGVPDGQHVYVGAVPDGFTTLGVELSGPESLVSDPAEIPEGEPFEMATFPDAFRVAEGVLEVPVRFRIDEDEGDVTVAVTVRFQSCTDRDCFPPAAVSLTLPLRAGGVLRRPK